MADYGFEVFGPTGSRWFSLTNRLIRSIEYFVIQTDTGSHNVPGLGDNGFYLLHYESVYGGGGLEFGDESPTLLSQRVWRDGDTLRWDRTVGRESWNEKDHPQKIHVQVVLFR